MQKYPFSAFPALFLLFAAAGPVLGQEQPAFVQVDAVRIEPMKQTRPVLGRIVTKQQGQVAARVGGLVARVGVDVGDRVAAGTILVELDAEPMQYEMDLADAEFDAAEADRLTAEAEIALLENELERIDQLKNSAAFSKAQREDKVKEIAVAKGRLSAAAARLGEYRAKQGSSRRNLQDMVIKAPYDGVVTRKLVSAGAYVRLGDPVVALMDDSSFEIEADVSVDQLQSLVPGAEITMTIAREKRVATVRAVVPEENPLTRTRAVRLTPMLDGFQGNLAVAQSVTLDIPVGTARDVATVSKDGVMQRPNGAMVFVVRDAAATPQPVRLGGAVDGRFEVLDGLGDGDLVVIRGNERLRPGQPVTYPGAPETPAAEADPAAESKSEG